MDREREVPIEATDGDPDADDLDHRHGVRLAVGGERAPLVVDGALDLRQRQDLDAVGPVEGHAGLAEAQDGALEHPPVGELELIRRGDPGQGAGQSDR